MAKLWPLSVITASFTLLTNFDSLSIYAENLSILIDRWRELVHAIFEVPLNAILSLFGWSIDLQSPVPELLTIASVYYLGVRYSHRLEEPFDSNYLNALLNPVLYIMHKNNRLAEEGNPVAHIGSTVSLVIMTLFLFLFVNILLGFMTVSFIVVSLIWVSVSFLIPIIAIRANEQQISDNLRSIYLYNISFVIQFVPAIVMASVYLVAGAWALEVLLEAAADFSAGAS